MKSHILGLRVILVAPLLAVIAACPAKAPELAPHDMTVTISESNAFLDAWLAAREAGDSEPLKPMYYGKTGFIWVEEGRTMYNVGDDAAAALDFASTGGYTPRLSFGEREITPLAPNVAAISADYTQSLSFGGLEIKTKGIFTGVIVNEDGQWKFVQGHFSAPTDELPAPAEPAVTATETVPATEPAASEPATPN
jgi:SnoaL-like domain